MLQLRHMFFGSRILGERPGQHELGLEYGAARIDCSRLQSHHTNFKKPQEF
jgi:hypothetical protein